jgi:coproporphyrinogen III oxidase-like Fe-S oxidoreductase
LPIDDSEEVGGDTGRLESVWLGLRTNAGISFSALSQTAVDMVSVWVSKGWAMNAGDMVRLTASGWLLLDRLTAELDSVLTDGSGSLASPAIDGDRGLVQISANPNSSDR